MRLYGNPVSQGISIGKVLLYQGATYEVSKKNVDANRKEEELDRFHHAMKTAEDEIDHLIEDMQSQGNDKSKIFAAHKEILEDEEMVENITTAIMTENNSAEYAVNQTYQEFIQLFDQVKDPLIASRAVDLNDVKTRLLRILSGEEVKKLTITEPVIIVANDLLPSDTANIDCEHVVGIITKIGGINSHTAIIARSNHIPAVLGVKNINELEHGSIIILDAIKGEIESSPDQDMLNKAKEAASKFSKRQQQREQYRSLPGRTADGWQIEIGINIGSKNMRPSNDYDFVGLFRTEFIYMESEHLPTEEEQFKVYKQVLEMAEGKSVTFRTLDIGGDKTLPYYSLPKEENPFLGKRALRLCLDQTDIFYTQLRAILRASIYGNVKIMFPMVGSMDDIKKAKEAVNLVKEQLNREGIEFNANVRIGIMIEVPSIALLADHVANEVDFASVGTNDLTQYLCAADRMNQEVSSYYQPLSPSMLRILNYVIQQFNIKNKSLSICGELASNPEAAILLVGMGLRKLSMSEGNIGEVKAALSKVTMEQAQQYAQECLLQSTEEEIKEYLKHIES